MSSSSQTSFVSAEVLSSIETLRLELVEEIPRAEQLVVGLSKVHKVYLSLYRDAHDLLSPESIVSELKYHIKNHFALMLFVIDELQFLVDGKVVRSNKNKLLIAREFIHPTRKNDFKFGGGSVEGDKFIPLCVKSIEGYYFEEETALGHKTVRPEDLVMFQKGVLVDSMKTLINGLQTQVLKLCDEFHDAWGVLHHKRSTKFDEESFEILTKSNRYGVGVLHNRRLVRSFMCYSYKQFSKSLLVDQSIICNDNYSETIRVAAFLKRFHEVADLMETLKLRSPKSLSLETLLLDETLDILTAIEDWRRVVRVRVKNNDMEGFTVLKIIPEDDVATVIMSGQSSCCNSDFDSDTEDEDCSICIAQQKNSSCGVADESKCFSCAVRRSEITILAARRIGEHMARYRSIQHGVSEMVASQKVGQQIARRPESHFATMCIAGAFHQADMILDPLLKECVRESIENIKQIAVTITEPNKGNHSFVPLPVSFSFHSGETLTEEQGYSEDEDEVEEVNVSGRQTPSPYKKRRTILQNEDSINMTQNSVNLYPADEVCGSYSSREWWADSSPILSRKTTFGTPSPPICDLFGPGGGDLLQDNNDNEADITSLADDFLDSSSCDSGINNSYEDDNDLEDVANRSVVAIDEHLRYLAMKKAMMLQAKEILFLEDREKAGIAALLLKHQKIQEKKQAEHKLYRERVNARHYAVYLELSGLSDKFF
jgi:hypothetical protein